MVIPIHAFVTTYPLRSFEMDVAPENPTPRPRVART